MLRAHSCMSSTALLCLALHPGGFCMAIRVSHGFTAIASPLTMQEYPLQVYFLGADTNVNYQPSSTWLAEQARDWPWRSHLLMNAPRSEALSVLSMEGMLVVFCSLVENMPYVVAEVPSPAQRNIFQRLWRPALIALHNHYNAMLMGIPFEDPLDLCHTALLLQIC